MKVDLFGTGGFTVATGVIPTAGGFTGTFTAPTTTTTGLEFLNAFSPGGSPECQAFTTFTLTP